MRDIHTDPDDSGHDSNFILHETSPNNLTQYRWRDPIPSPGEVADLLRATKGPEPGAAAAKDTIFKAYHRLVLKEAKAYCVAYGDACDRRNDDLIAAGNLGLAEAIDRFNLNRNNGFTAYALHYIRKRLKETSKSFNRNGWAGETRLQRAVYGNHDLTPEQASKVMGRPVDEDEIERARTEVLGMCSELLPYDTREPDYEDDEEDRPRFTAVPAPLCPAQLIRSRAHNWVDRLVEDTDRRAMRRLKQIGRRAYALELVGPTEHLFAEPPPPPLPLEKPKPNGRASFWWNEPPRARVRLDRSGLPRKKRPPEYYPTWGNPPTYRYRWQLNAFKGWREINAEPAAALAA
jgi:hypothetical protein